jgi:hypothetical protein
MNRSLRVACIELSCFLADAPKNNSTCEGCKNRLIFLKAIGNGGMGPVLVRLEIDKVFVGAIANKLVGKDALGYSVANEFERQLYGKG